VERASIDWFADDAFWVASYPFMFPDASFVSAAEDIPKIVALSGCEGRTVLDLCCGPGRYAVPLAKHGYAVTGVDRTPFLVEKARAYAAAEQVHVEWVLEDMRRFLRPAAFDLTLSLYTSFGYFEEVSENRAVLHSVFTSLTANGVLVLDVAGKEVLARIFQPTGSQTLSNGALLIQRRTVVDDWSRLDNEWIIITDGGVQRFHLRHWVYSGRELKELLASVGFAHIALYGDFEGAAYGPNARRLIAVARKGLSGA
jgi:SAM-dependent methyltransferase